MKIMPHKLKHNSIFQKKEVMEKPVLKRAPFFDRDLISYLSFIFALGVLNILNLNEKLIKKIDSLIKESSSINNKEEAEMFITRIRNLIIQIVGKESIYYERIIELEPTYQMSGLSVRKLSINRDQLTALRDDIKTGNLITYSELIHAKIFSDYLEMAKELLKEGYKDAAAVIAGSTLEAHLRKLCLKNTIAIEFQNNRGKMKLKSANILNADLARKQVYTKIENKQILAWQGIRNDAAHGDYDEYDEKQVDLLIQGVENFVSKYLA